MTFPLGSLQRDGAQALAAELGLALITPDTSPRGAGVPGEAEAWDFGVGAGFYLDATQAPWAAHWRMESWLVQELLPLLGASLPIDLQRMALTGHSMGGHGALTLGLRHPALFRSVSAIAPIVAPSEVPWGIKAFSGYLGPDRSTWAPHQGEADPFLAEQLQPERLEAACAAVGQPLTLRRHAGYDHGYYFVQTVVGEHLRWHARALGLAG